MNDLLLRDNGSVWLLVPVTEFGEYWIAENIVSEITIGNAIVVEPRYVQDIVNGARNDGLTVGAGIG